MKTILCTIGAFIILFGFQECHDTQGAVAGSDSIQITGRVRDNWWYPVEAAKVSFITKHDTLTAFTNRNGFYSLALPRIMTSTVSSGSIPNAFTLFQNHPNPFNPSTVVDFSLHKSFHVRIDIFSITGQRVRTLINDYRDTGRYSVAWDGIDDDGCNVGSGVYLYRLSAGENSETRKMVLLDGSVGGKVSPMPGRVMHHDVRKLAQPDISVCTVLIEREGYEKLTTQDIDLLHDNDSIEYNFTIRRILPEGISDKDVVEIIRLAFFNAMNPDDMWIFDTVDVIGKKFAFMSTENVDLTLFPELPDIHLSMIDPENIQDKADIEGTYMYFKFNPFIFEESKVTVGLLYIQAESKNDILHDFIGGGFRAEFTKENSTWKAKLIGKFII